MMGRSNRKQAQGKGYIFIDIKFLQMAPSAIKYIQSKEENRVREGGQNLKEFYKFIQ
jgi:hypothetical protein